MKVLACAVGFGLGPGGKLCSIVDYNEQFEWYACGDELDLAIYKKNPYIDTCWSKDEKILGKFLEKYDIKYAVNVLDPDLAIFLKRSGVKVIYVDSLPFMWTKADLIPYDVDYYCAQKYPDYSMNPALDPVKNFVWINPVTPGDIVEEKKGGIVINFGGLHSPFGEGKEYFEMMMKVLLSFFPEKKISISGGKNVVNLTRELFPTISCATYSHKDFLRLVAESELFITSPGLTTIYETCAMDIKTVILPPQNLSQFYNASIAEKSCKNVKVLSWNREYLSSEYLERFKEQPEEETVKYIYEQIRILSCQEEYVKEFSQYMSVILRDEFKLNETERFENSGVEKVSDILCKMMREI